MLGSAPGYKDESNVGPEPGGAMCGQVCREDPASATEKPVSPAPEVEPANLYFFLSDKDVFVTLWNRPDSHPRRGLMAPQHTVY